MVGLGLLAGCGVYYVIWVWVLPRIYGYGIRTETLVLEQDGAVTHRLLKIPNSKIGEWDRTHDDAGNVIADGLAEGDSTGVGAGDSGGGKFLKRIYVKGSDSSTPPSELKA